MNVRYLDIIERAGSPDWWGPQGVPRYGEFNPDVLSVYAMQAVLYEVACQGCGRIFKVASYQDMHDAPMSAVQNDRGDQSLKAEDFTLRRYLEEGNAIPYGDPPEYRLLPRRWFDEYPFCPIARVSRARTWSSLGPG